MILNLWLLVGLRLPTCEDFSVIPDRISSTEGQLVTRFVSIRSPISDVHSDRILGFSAAIFRSLSPPGLDYALSYPPFPIASFDRIRNGSRMSVPAWQAISILSQPVGWRAVQPSACRLPVQAEASRFRASWHESTCEQAKAVHTRALLRLHLISGAHS